MDEHSSGLEELLAEAGWLPFPAPLERPSTGCSFFACDYAAAGFIVDPNAEAASLLWQPMQGILAELRSKELIPAAKDLYLVLVVPEIRGELVPAFHRIANDTYVCRKIVLETKGRGLRQALAEVPLFALGEETASSNSAESKDGIEPQLPRALLDDLARRSATVVLERTLAGSYRPEGSSDED